MNAVSVTYSRSSGPGGQNVNKVDTKVDLRFHVKTSNWIPEAVREKILIKVRLADVECLSNDPNEECFRFRIFSLKIKSTRMVTLW